ncbi:MAG: N-acetylglucosamine kinase [Ferruginibacter sp.]|nr:N-acetylglucosamine kinase [Ferruginibacter sp.]
MPTIIIADSGSTQTTWAVVSKNKKRVFQTQGLSPYFLSEQQTIFILKNELLPQMKRLLPDTLYFYGTGCGNAENVKMLTKCFKAVFKGIKIYIKTDILGAARAVCGDKKGVVCILGTGSSVCYYNGKAITHARPGLGFILGDEGSGSYLGKKVLQYYLNDTFEPDLMDRFRMKYPADKMDILNAVYRGAFPNRYLASFTPFLVENRGHFMVENIIEDGLNDFFFNHICKLFESWKTPIHFVGSVAFGFKDVIKDLCLAYEFEMGNMAKSPIDGLIKYHS